MRVIALLMTTLALVSCGQSFNSNTQNSFLVPLTSCDNQSNTNLCSANAVIQERCVSCHTDYHSDWGVYTTDTAWINDPRNLTDMGNADGIFRRLRNVEGNMPQGGVALENDEFQLIQTWLEGIAPNI